MGSATGSPNSRVVMISTSDTVRPSRCVVGCWRKAAELGESALHSDARFANDASCRPAFGSSAPVRNGIVSRSRLHFLVHTALVTERGAYSECVRAACTLYSPVNLMSASCWTRTHRNRYPLEFSIESSLAEGCVSPLTSMPWIARLHLRPLRQPRTPGTMCQWLAHQKEVAIRRVGRAWCASSAAPSSTGVTTGRGAEKDEGHEPWSWSQQSVTGLTTPWSRSLRLSAPIVNAPMGGVAGGILAAAVTCAGGLGMIGVGSAGSQELLQREAAYPRAFRLQFGIGLLDWVSARDPELLEAAIAAGPALISVSFGDDWNWVTRVRDAGISTATQVSTVELARRAADCGFDIIVARGAEGGGHGEPLVGTLPLLEGVLDAVAVPVLAAGGISSGRGLAAVLAAGASGVWMGTAFAASSESLATAAARTALFDAQGSDTVTTTVFDAALAYPWPAKYPERVLRNELWQRWSTKESLFLSDPEARAEFAEDRGSGDSKTVHVDAGQGVGLLIESRSASEIVDDMCDEAVALLQQWISLRGE